MTNKGKLKVLVGVFFCFIVILAALLVYVKSVYVNNQEPTNSTAVAVTNSSSDSGSDISQQSSASGSSEVKSETVDLKLYYYDADNYDSPKEIRTIAVDKKLYQEDITAAINKVLSSTPLKLNKAVVNGKEITVDLPKDVGLKFNSGSAGGITYTNILAMTVLNLPGIETMQVTVDGTANYTGDHFNFNGIFSKTKDGKYDFTESDKESKSLD